jgi:hypothetical protein
VAVTRGQFGNPVEGNFRRWKPLREDWRRESTRGGGDVWIGDSATVHCDQGLDVSSISKYQSTPHVRSTGTLNVSVCITEKSVAFSPLANCTDRGPSLDCELSANLCG